MRKYVWKSVGFLADANIVGDELEKIENAGELTSESVLNYARKHEDSELYKCFEWDDAIASEKYRMFQSSQIISSIAIVTDEVKQEKTKVYVSIKNSDNKRTMKNIAKVLESDDEYNQIIIRAKKELEACKDKYEKLIELQDLKDIIFDMYSSM